MLQSCLSGLPSHTWRRATWRSRWRTWMPGCASAKLSTLRACSTARTRLPRLRGPTLRTADNWDRTRAGPGTPCPCQPGLRAGRRRAMRRLYLFRCSLTPWHAARWSCALVEKSV